MKGESSNARVSTGTPRFIRWGDNVDDSKEVEITKELVDQVAEKVIKMIQRELKTERERIGNSLPGKRLAGGGHNGR